MSFDVIVYFIGLLSCSILTQSREIKFLNLFPTSKQESADANPMDASPRFYRMPVISTNPDSNPLRAPNTLNYLTSPFNKHSEDNENILHLETRNSGFAHFPELSRTSSFITRQTDKRDSSSPLAHMIRGSRSGGSCSEICYACYHLMGLRYSSLCSKQCRWWRGPEFHTCLTNIALETGNNHRSK